MAQMQLTGINVPVRIGRAVVLPGDLVLAKQDGVIFVPATLAAAAIGKAEFTNLQDACRAAGAERANHGKRLLVAGVAPYPGSNGPAHIAVLVASMIGIEQASDFHRGHSRR